MATAVKKISMANDSLGTGRRKKSVARVRIRPGGGNIVINDRPFEEYFTIDEHRSQVIAPLEHVGKRSELDVTIRVHGGGNTGQAGACMLGIARALLKFDSETIGPLRRRIS